MAFGGVEKDEEAFSVSPAKHAGDLPPGLDHALLAWHKAPLFIRSYGQSHLPDNAALMGVL